MNDPIKRSSDNLLRHAVHPDGAHAPGIRVERTQNRRGHEIAAAVAEGVVSVERQGAALRLVLTKAGQKRLTELTKAEQID